MRYYSTELADAQDEEVGWGFKIVMDEGRRLGHEITRVSMHGAPPLDMPDVWLVSFPYAGNIRHIKAFFDAIGQPYDRTKRTCKTRFVVGGHAVVNPNPLLDVFDAAFVGDIDDVSEAFFGGPLEPDRVPGLIVNAGDAVTFQTAASLDKRGWYFAGYGEGKEGVGETRYLEVAKGCEVGCSFCELGWAHKYVQRSREETEAMIAEANASTKKKDTVILSAPHTDGVSWYSDKIADRSYSPRFRSTTVFRYLKTDEVPKAGKRGKIRFGVEGVTERLRKIAGKRISDEMLEEAINRGVREGYAHLRMFLIGGLPTETGTDREHIQHLIDIYRRSEIRHWKSAEIKITGLSPQPFTPLQRMGISGSIKAIDHYRMLHRAMQKADPYWRSVMIDTHTAEADLLKHMRQGELLAYLEVCSTSDQRELSTRVRRSNPLSWAEDSGLDMDRIFNGYAMTDALPWDNVDHPMMKHIKNGEAVMWIRHATADRLK